MSCPASPKAGSRAQREHSLVPSARRAAGEPRGQTPPQQLCPHGLWSPSIAPHPSSHPASLSQALPLPGPPSRSSSGPELAPLHWPGELVGPARPWLPFLKPRSPSRPGAKAASLSISLLRPSQSVCLQNGQMPLMTMLYTSVKTLLILPGAAVTKHHRRGGLKQQTIPIWLFLGPGG